MTAVSRSPTRATKLAFSSAQYTGFSSPSVLSHLLLDILNADPLSLLSALNPVLPSLLHQPSSLTECSAVGLSSSALCPYSSLFSYQVCACHTIVHPYHLVVALLHLRNTKALPRRHATSRSLALLVASSLLPPSLVTFLASVQYIANHFHPLVCSPSATGREIDKPNSCFPSSAVCDPCDPLSSILHLPCLLV